MDVLRMHTSFSHSILIKANKHSFVKKKEGKYLRKNKMKLLFICLDYFFVHFNIGTCGGCPA